MTKHQMLEDELLTAMIGLGLSPKAPLAMRRTELSSAVGRMWTTVRPMLAKLAQAGAIRTASRNGTLTIELQSWPSETTTRGTIAAA